MVGRAGNGEQFVAAYRTVIVTTVLRRLAGEDLPDHRERLDSAFTVLSGAFPN
ncbi:hypothetical protein [Amycolatopsis sp. cmx-11-12]|uniref:hypothetical protein n=1 Tax=Amycolatopsis sp. cmx-11-12 TaxID=2785795 RepID=UPI003917348C